METLKIGGYSVGDSSVGIGLIEFSVNTGLEEVTENEKKFMIKTIIKSIWELHDNGNLIYQFSDEINEVKKFTYKDAEYINKETLIETIK